MFTATLVYVSTVPGAATPTPVPDAVRGALATPPPLGRRPEAAAAGRSSARDSRELAPSCSARCSSPATVPPAASSRWRPTPGRRGPRQPRPQRPDAAQRHDVRAARAPLRVLHLRHALVRQRGHRARPTTARRCCCGRWRPWPASTSCGARRGPRGPPTVRPVLGPGPAVPGARHHRRARRRRPDAGGPDGPWLADDGTPPSPRSRASRRASASPSGVEHPWRWFVPGDRQSRLAGPERRRASMTAAMDLIDDLQARGLIHDATDLDALAGPPGRRVRSGSTCGFDPTADSLHVGPPARPAARCGGSSWPATARIPLAGGATGMVGDPSGRSEERNLLDREHAARPTSPASRPSSSASSTSRRAAEPGRPGRQRRLDRADRRARVPPRRRQARHRQPDAGQGVGADPHGAATRASPTPSSATCSCRPTTSGGCTSTRAASSRWAAPTSGATSPPASTSSAARWAGPPTA